MGEFSSSRLLLFALGAGFVVLFVWIVRNIYNGFIDDAKRRRRRDRLLSDACLQCGYDLRGGHERCPECGKPVRETDEPAENVNKINIAKLHRDWPDAPIDPVTPSPMDALAEIHFTTNSQEAKLVVQQMNARGIWCVSQRKEVQEQHGRSSELVSYNTLFVPQSEKDRADTILNRFRGPIERILSSNIDDDK